MGSRRCWAWRMRARWSHWKGVVPGRVGGDGGAVGIACVLVVCLPGLRRRGFARYDARDPQP
ncbi:hypothetical protein ACIBCU_03500 [Streptomyces sp. NPDC051064]|uniref:hypothetical protein n=1 Tax=Streptomyces sp. NPDC051064 TaxID=3365641 RepID=UPI0037899F29